jgi:hypothetical protein
MSDQLAITAFDGKGLFEIASAIAKQSFPDAAP